jgi:hypothetical protein
MKSFSLLVLLLVLACIVQLAFADGRKELEDLLNARLADRTSSNSDALDRALAEKLQYCNGKKCVTNFDCSSIACVPGMFTYMCSDSKSGKVCTASFG